ncbi:MAG TPA: DUF2232 domain-containing protein [Gemmatimonadaceae bacterium]|nr:DUF2232 domain-containing protein [Gemmatimonadaceae bacterium]
MDEAVAPAPREQGWKQVLLALAAFLLVPMMPVLRAIVPVEQTALLLVPALAVCTLLGWLSGGKLALALIWSAVAAWVLVQRSAPGASAYHDLARGWGLLSAGAFGLVCVLGSGRTFLSRALSAVALATVIASALVLAGTVDGAGAARALQEQYAARNAQTIVAWQEMVARYADEWSRLVASVPATARLALNPEGTLHAMSALSLAVFPALLALESIAALALAWALYHRLSRARLGAPLAPLREFRFNDQLVWGLIVGFAVVFLPAITGLRGAGLNLLVFFGTLYVLRGLGIIAFFLAPGGLVIALAFIFAMLVWPVFAVLAAATAALALGLGLGDTWLDWRRRTRPTS